MSQDGPFHTHCENCDAPLAGPYCHKCGQHDFEFHRSFGHVVHDALENFFHFDAKLFRNVVTLLFQPGRLTAAFNAGKRVSQVPPFRLYVFVAFVFFAIIFWGRDEENALAFGPVADNDTRAPASSAGAPDFKSTIARGIEADATERQRARAAELGADAPKSDFEQWIESKARRALQPENRRAMGHAFVAAMPKILIFCLPFFALYTRVLFRKSGQVYLQHLVIAVHFHTFLFLWMLWRNGWSGLIGLVGEAPAQWFTLACNLWMIIYPVVMLRRLFGNSWPRTLMKTAVLALAYVLTTALFFGATALLLFATV